MPNYILIPVALIGLCAFVALMVGGGVSGVAQSLQSDDTRLAAIAGSGSQSDGLHTLFQKVQLNKRDVDLIRRDVRRAVAAYPDIKDDDLLTGRWFSFDPAARVPSKGFGNAHGTMDKATGEYYLESAYMSVVRSEYPNRADDATTDQFFAARKVKQRADRLARLKEDGPFAGWSGTGGSMSVGLDKKTGKVIVQRAKEWASKADRWTMPFAPGEWLDTNEGDLEAIKKLPSFVGAIHEEVSVKPNGVTITMGPATSSGRPFNGVLMPGESMSVGVGQR